MIGHKIFFMHVNACVSYHLLTLNDIDIAPNLMTQSAKKCNTLIYKKSDQNRTY